MMIKAITSEGKSFLWFPETLSITHRYQTVGLLVAPELDNCSVLNFFRVFISANTRKKVEEFVAYLRQKNEEQAKAIQVVVERLDAYPSPPEPAQSQLPAPITLEDIEMLIAQGQVNFDWASNVGKVNVGIDRLYLNTPAPCKITYVIDPVITRLSSGLAFSTQFSADVTAVKCSVTSGAVRVDVRELDFARGWQSRSFLDVNSGFELSAGDITKATSGQWQVNVTGVMLNNEFTLEYSRVV